MDLIKKFSSENYNNRLPGTFPRFLIMHYTACDFPLSLHLLTSAKTDSPVSSHYLIDEAGVVYSLVDEKYRAWHAGPDSTWRHYQGINSWSIGIELVNPGMGKACRPFPKEQMASLLELSQDILSRYLIPAHYILGHGDIASARKVDPGSHFNWRWLAEHGVGLYPDSLLLAKDFPMPCFKEIKNDLYQFGYPVTPSTSLDDSYRNSMRAFCLHYVRQTSYINLHTDISETLKNLIGRSFPTMNATDVLTFWFESCTPQQWFMKDKAFDEKIRNQFANTYDAAAMGRLDSWQENPTSLLALILILDQFPRNIFRDSSKSFETDAKALELAKLGITKEFDSLLPSSLHRNFLYMPFMHSESLEDQDKSVYLFKENGDSNAYDYALQHRNIIARFGRFPHRNKILGRESTGEEKEFLMTPGSSF